ncbi:alpha/beta hydrolase [Flavobacterium sp.]|uniref:alpha/beta hydrolase n=1 Tax=Flavobacterium sp. TaxID=239 RepID=UPI00286EA0DD|nr:alpha/beta hydrolase [Flavobacterium sp.]
MKTNNFFYFLLLILIVSCNSNDSSIINVPPKVEETVLNVSYGSNDLQTYDVYLPASRTKETTKTLIVVHGGGWIEGDKSDTNYLVDIIKRNLSGYAIVNMNYRLATIDNPAFPMQIDDIKSVVNKLKTSNYSISDNLGFIGLSAGAHLSLLYSYDYDTNNQVKMVASIVGPTNLTDANYVNNQEWIDLYFSITGLNYIDNINYFENISPLFKATSTSPPTIMLYGNADPLIPTTQGVDLNAKLNQLGVYNEFYLYNGGHGDWAPIDQLNAYTKMINFIKNKF